MASDKRQSPRQRMINLMYLVFIAMLALSFPEEILDGFDLVNDSLLENVDNTTTRNNQIYAEIEASYKMNPEKTKVWFERAQEVNQKSDSLFNYIQYLKLEIAKKSDGPEADADNLKYKENLDASPEVMIVGKQGDKLKDAIDQYRNDILSRITDENKQKIIANSLSTEPRPKSADDNRTWVQASFESMPSIAVLTYLSSLQSNIKQAEGEALNSLLKNIDFSDFRVNNVEAFVVPQSNVVMRGTSYKANIVLAAVDTTQRPRIVIDGKELPSENNGIYQIPAGATGLHSFSGYVEMTSRDGVSLRRPFTQEYTIMEPMATIAPLLMDVVYAGIDNPLSISVPGVVDRDVTARAEGGTLTKSGNNWVARPARAGQNFVVTVFSNMNGVQQTVARKEFRVRLLPDPTPFIEYKDENGNSKMFKRGALARSIILNTNGVKAAIDDGILNIPFTVIAFRTIFVDAMGNAMPEVSDGANFSARQLDQIRRMARGKYFFISGVKVKGPDGIEREIAPMEVRIN